MRSILFFPLALIAITTCPEAHASECDSVLIPTIGAFEDNTRTALDTLSIIQNSIADDKSKKDNYSVTVPIYGVPVQFGYQSDSSSQFRQSTLSYFKQQYTRDESVWSLYSDVSNEKAQIWLECMQRDSQFFAYFNKKTITAEDATFFTRRWVSGPPRNSLIHLTVKGGTIKGKTDVDITTKNNGEMPFRVKRNGKERVSIEASMDAGAPITAIIPEVLPPPKFPTVVIRAWGNLQMAKADQRFPHQFHIQVFAPGGVKFASNNVLLHIEEIVDGKLCASRTISSANLGDMMSSPPHWRLDQMRAGCQMDAVPVASFVECFIDPLYFTQCQ
ncbi:hypothetical protein NKI72_32220 [Mesorhizobium sp. M0437]|uniref:hypothetical protein n=1 Tax=Mesorhizobium sp. M0437 TaxID=2956945 RepID=UPI00333950CF